MAARVALVNFPKVKKYKSRHGRIYFYHRPTGTRLPDDPTTPEFAEAYARAEKQGQSKPDTPLQDGKRPKFPHGSFGAVVEEFIASGEFKDLKPSTKYEYQRVLRSLADAGHGNKPIRMMQRRHVRKMRDERADTPGAANTVVRHVRRLLSFAVEEEYRADNPALRLKLLKVGEWRAWTDEEQSAFEARWPSGSMERRAYSLALYTGQRRADLVSMTQADRKSGAICVVQSKTDERLWVPEHPTLSEELRAIDHMSLLYTSKGKAFDPVYFGAWFAEAIDKAKLPDDCVLHGLRASAATRLADAGCDDKDIMAITGHQSPQMVKKYTKAADQKKRAESAMQKVKRLDAGRKAALKNNDKSGSAKTRG